MHIRYTGLSDERVLTGADMQQLGVEDHAGLWWPAGQRVIEVEDEAAAEALLTQLHREFKEEVIVDPDAKKDDLLAQAEGLGIEVPAKATKQEIADLIEQHALNGSTGSPASPPEPPAG